jgi:hypothetical protein
VDARPAGEHAARIVIANNYQWIGSPAAAGFTVYLDGKRAGVAPPGDTFSQQVVPGTYVVRVRLWYFLSPRVKLDLKPGETRRFSADIPRKLRLWRRMMRMADPLHSLSLEEVTRPGPLVSRRYRFAVTSRGGPARPRRRRRAAPS